MIYPTVNECKISQKFRKLYCKEGIFKCEFKGKHFHHFQSNRPFKVVFLDEQQNQTGVNHD